MRTWAHQIRGAVLATLAALYICSCGSSSGSSGGKAPPAPHQNITPPYECLACHAAGTSSNAPKVSASHAGKTNDQCMSCHAPGGSGGSTCDTCLASKCQGQLSTCQNNPACAQLVQCLGKCTANDQACANNCAAQYQGGISDLSALVQCAQQSCATQCSTG